MPLSLPLLIPPKDLLHRTTTTQPWVDYNHYLLDTLVLPVVIFTFDRSYKMYVSPYHKVVPAAFITKYPQRLPLRLVTENRDDK